MTELSGTAFADTVKSEQLSVVDFWAAWCMPCKIFAPILEQAADELDGQASFYKLNIDDNNDLAQQYAVSSIPTVILYKNGEEVDRMVGVNPKDKVMELLQKHL